MSNNCNAMIARGAWCYFCELPFGHGAQHEHKELSWSDGDKGAEPANLARMPESFRKEHEVIALRAEAAELREALAGLVGLFQLIAHRVPQEVMADVQDNHRWHDAHIALAKPCRAQVGAQATEGNNRECSK